VTATRRARAVLLGTVLTVAVCGFVYELVLIALGTYLFGNSVFQVSVVLASFVSAMGLGSLAAKPLLGRPVEAFVLVEAACRRSSCTPLSPGPTSSSPR